MVLHCCSAVCLDWMHDYERCIASWRPPRKRSFCRKKNMSLKTRETRFDPFQILVGFSLKQIEASFVTLVSNFSVSYSIQGSQNLVKAWQEELFSSNFTKDILIVNQLCYTTNLRQSLAWEAEIWEAAGGRHVRRLVACMGIGCLLSQCTELHGSSSFPWLPLAGWRATTSYLVLLHCHQVFPGAARAC